MDIWNIESAKTIAIFVAPVVSCTTLLINLYDKFSKRPRLVLQVENASVIEDYPGELGIQINITLRAYNGSFFLKNFEIKNIKRKVNNDTSQISLEVRGHISENIVEKYLDLQKWKTVAAEKEERKIDQFTYNAQLQSKKVAMRTDDFGNPVLPVITSDFQNSLGELCKKQIIRESRYKEISEKIESIRDLKIDDGISRSLTVFFHIYGKFEENVIKRKLLPLSKWKFRVAHSEGKLEKMIKGKQLSYLQIKEILGS